jgi:adenosylhomocysteine nucleosidase
MKWFLLSLLAVALPVSAHTKKNTRQVLVISGMTSEGNIAAGPGVISVLSGGSPEILQTVLAGIDPSTVSAVISFGVGGGTNSKMKSGNVNIGTGVVDVETGAALPTDPTLTAEILAALKGSGLKVRSGIEAVVDNNQDGYSASQKAAIGAKTGSLAVDNESMVSAQWAVANGLPYAIIRTVDDPQSLTLPPAALIPLNADGTPNYDAVMQSIWDDPGQLPALIEVAFDESEALSSLQWCADLVNLGGL